MQKSKTRLYINKEISSNLLIYIKDKQHHFLRNVIRVQIEDTINIFDSLTGEWVSKVLSVNRNNTVLRVVKKIKNMTKSKDVWLIFAPIKQLRLNMVAQKATELGASMLIPCLTEYTNNRSVNIKNIKLNAIEAAEQSGRLDIPKIEKPLSINSILTSWPEDRYLIYCDEKLKNDKNIIKSLFTLKNNIKKWAILIGPEGGFSDAEQELITKKKYVIPVSLGDRPLRSDTAITVSLFCINKLLNK